MAEIQLSAGTIEYEDTGQGPLLVLIHGATMNGSLWRNVVGELCRDHRCVVPTLPLGGHRIPMNDDADLSLRGQVGILVEVLERLELRDATLVASDWGGPQLLSGNDRVARLVLTSCEAFDNFPPGLPGKNLQLTGRMPGVLALAVRALKLRALRRTPITYGWMSKRPVPDEVMDDWLRPLTTQPEVRRDLAKYVHPLERDAFVKAAEQLRSFDRPALVVWATEDRVMPPEHGRRLAELLPQGRLVEIADSYTLIPEDQPLELARVLREFVRETTPMAA
ncbi:MAG: alpha/beta fold hydrolase [Thermoleophilaceae bacterium]